MNITDAGTTQTNSILPTPLVGRLPWVCVCVCVRTPIVAVASIIAIVGVVGILLQIKYQATNTTIIISRPISRPLVVVFDDDDDDDKDDHHAVIDISNSAELSVIFQDLFLLI